MRGVEGARYLFSASSSVLCSVRSGVEALSNVFWSLVLVVYFVEGRDLVGFIGMCWVGLGFQKVIRPRGRELGWDTLG